MFATTHALTGALIGRVTTSPVAAFAVGVASHGVLDTLPHWGVARRGSGPGDPRVFWRVAVADGLLLAATMSWLVRRGEPRTVAGASGAVLLDLNKPAEVVGIPLWGKRVNAWHNDIQRREAPRRWPIDVGVALAALVALRHGHQRGEQG